MFELLGAGAALVGAGASEAAFASKTRVPNTRARIVALMVGLLVLKSYALNNYSTLRERDTSSTGMELEYPRAHCPRFSSSALRHSSAAHLAGGGFRYVEKAMDTPNSVGSSLPHTLPA